MIIKNAYKVKAYSVVFIRVVIDKQTTIDIGENIARIT